MLSWACTTHNVLCLSLDSAVVSFDLFKQRLTGTFTAAAIKTDSKAIQKCERLRLESPLLSQTFAFVSCDSLTVNLLYARSLHKRSFNIICDQRPLQYDLLGFRETQILAEQNTDNIKEC